MDAETPSKTVGTAMEFIGGERDKQKCGRPRVYSQRTLLSCFQQQAPQAVKAEETDAQ